MTGEGGNGGTTATSAGTKQAGDRAAPDPATSEARAPAKVLFGEANLLSLPLAIATFWLTFWCVDIVSPGLPILRDSLGFSDTLAGLVVSAFFSGRLIANLPAAILVDRAGARRTTAIGAGLLLAGSIGAAIAGGAALLLPARVLQGTGVSLLVAAALLSTLRAQTAGGAAMTTFNVSAGLGGASGLISGGLLAGEVGWRSMFWLSALLAAAMAAASLLGPRRAAKAIPGPDDVRPDAAPIVAEPERGRRRALGAALLANLLVYVNYSTWVVTVPLFAAERFGSSAGGIGVLLLVSNVIHLLGAFPSGRAVRRWGGDRTLVAGFALTAVGTAAMLLAPAPLWLLLPLAAYSVGQVCSNTAAGDQVLRLGGLGGRAVGLVRFSTDVGLVVGPFAVGVLADLFGVAAPFAVLAALTVVFALAIWREGRADRRAVSPL